MCVGAFIRRRRALLLERRYFRIRDAGSVIWPIVKDVSVKRAGVFAGCTPPRGNTVADNLTPSREGGDQFLPLDVGVNTNRWVGFGTALQITVCKHFKIRWQEFDDKHLIQIS